MPETPSGGTFDTGFPINIVGPKKPSAQIKTTRSSKREGRPVTLAAKLVRRARERSGMSQRELAARASLSQPEIARIETGAQDPRLTTLERLLRGAGFELSAEMRRTPTITGKTLEHMRRLSRLTTEERSIDATRQLERFAHGGKRKRLRIKRGTGHVTYGSHRYGIGVAWGTRPEDIPPIRLDWLLQALQRWHVKPVILGAMAAHVRGFPVLVTRIDITVTRTSCDLTNLGAAFRDLHARVFSPSVPRGFEFDFARDVLKTSPEWQLVTEAGRVRIILARPGSGAYDDLARNAEYFAAFGVRFLVASLNDILDPIEVSGRFREPEYGPALRAMIIAGRTL